MAERLRAAGVDHRLDVFPGARHGLDFRDDAWPPTVAFLETHLTGEADDGTAPASPAVFGAAAVAVLGAAGALVLRRRRQLRGDKATDCRPV